MKKFKTLASVVLVMMMILSMMVPVMAASITINSSPDSGTDTTETYKAYKIFDASISGDNVAYTITSDNPFYNVIKNYKENETTVFTLTQINSTDEYTVVANIDYDAEALANALSAVITDSTAIVGTTSSSTDGKYVINGLADGYYLITSTLGSKMIIDTLSDKEIDTKNSYPTLTKSVDCEDAQIGDNVFFTLTVTVPATVNKDMVITDTYDNSFTVDYDSFSVRGAGDTTLTENTDYVVAQDGDSFTLTLKPTANVVGETVIIYYYAELNTNAGYCYDNHNIAVLAYSNYETPEQDVAVYSMSGGIKKIDGNTSALLEGAKFKIYRDETGDNPIKFIYDENYGYIVADSTSENTTDTIEAGLVNIRGFDSSVTYYVEEIEAPAGYNMLTKREVLSFRDDDGNRRQTLLEIKNYTGTELPSTGGIGTTIFYCVGGIMAVGAFVLLITKKRMNRGM